MQLYSLTKIVIIENNPYESYIGHAGFTTSLAKAIAHRKEGEGRNFYEVSIWQIRDELDLDFEEREAYIEWRMNQ